MASVDTQSENIKQRSSYSRKTSNLFWTQISDQDNPFVQQIKDDEKLKEIFRDRPFIPYNGTNQDPCHSLLNVLKILAELSPTHSSVINALSFYCFGGKISLVNSVDTEFSLSQNELSEVQAKPYFEYLQLIKPKHGFRDLAQKLFFNRKYSGEHYVRVDYYELAGIRSAKISCVDNLQILPVIPEPGEPDTFILFTSYQQVSNKKYETVGKYPYITVNKDGSYSTIISFINTDYYRGRPKEKGIMIDTYREYKDNIFLTRQSANNFTPQVFIESEDPDPNMYNAENDDALKAGFESLEARMRYNLTNNGDDPQSILHSNRPFGTSPAFVYEFKQNTSEKWFNITGSITENRIIKAHSWSSRLMDGNVANGLSSNQFIDELKIKLPLIELHQSIEESTINTAIDSALNWMNIDFSGIDIKFTNPFKTMIDNVNNSVGGGTL